MAVKERTTRDGIKRYTATYLDGAGHQRSAGTFSSRTAAKNAYAKAKADVLRGIDPGPGKQRRSSRGLRAGR